VVNSRRGLVLIEILVVLIILGLLVAAYFGLRGRPTRKPQQAQFPGQAQTLPGRAIQKGQSVECMNNLRQLRAAVEMYQVENGTYPPQLDPAWGIPLKCPVSGYPYRYDPQTGRVQCPTPGHERY